MLSASLSVAAVPDVTGFWCREGLKKYPFADWTGCEGLRQPEPSIFFNSPLIVLHTQLGREADPLEVVITAIQFFHFASSRVFEKRMPFFFIATDVTNLFCVEGASHGCSGLMSAALTLRSECHRHHSALINGRNSLLLAMKHKSINCACLSSRYSKSDGTGGSSPRVC